MNVFWNVFKHSIKLPQRQAVFALNRIGMDIAVLYLFFLLAIASLPALFDQLLINETTFHIQSFFLLIYIFIFYYLPLVFIVFGGLSIIAYIGTRVARLSSRKLRFSILWKMSAFITTIPLLLFSIISFFYPLTFIFLTLAILFIGIVLTKIILMYPKRKCR